MNYTRPKLQQKTKAQLIDIIMALDKVPPPEPEIITKEIEKFVPVEKPIPEGWKLIPEAHIVNTIVAYRDSVIEAIRNKTKLPISLKEIVNRIINHSS